MVRGGGGATTHSGLTNGVTYYYAAFSYDDSHNYAAGQTASATPALLVDHDRDGDVDQSDFGPLQACFSGAYTPPVMGCERYDFDYDADVDPDDVGMFSRCFSGAGVYAIPTCTD